MRSLSFLSLLAVPATVLACEGQCIVGVTNAWLSNYTIPIKSIMGDMAQQLSHLIPSQPTLETSLTYLKPIMSAYEKQSYSGMEDAIFPSFFHGKCLDDDGNTPPGCPNPDCPVVCGTPGSMVHFYSKLRYIAFNQTYHLLEALATPGSDTYQKVEDMVMAAAKQSPQKRRIYSRVFPRGYAGAPVNAMQNNQQGSSAPVPPVPAPGSGSHMAHAPGAGAPAAGEDALPGSRAGSSHQPAMFSELLSGDSGLSSLSSKNSNGLPLPGLKRRSQDIKAGLRSILQQIYSLLQQRCGGDGEGNTNGLADCSWEEEMKEYILSFP